MFNSNLKDKVDSLVIDVKYLNIFSERASRNLSELSIATKADRLETFKRFGELEYTNTKLNDQLQALGEHVAYQDKVIDLLLQKLQLRVEDGLRISDEVC